MNFYNALDYLKNNPSYLAKPSNKHPYALNIKYNTALDIFEWVRDNGEAVNDCTSFKGHKRVILSGKLSNTDCKLFTI